MSRLLRWLRRPFRWLRFRWRMWREPCPMAKLKMQVGYELLPVAEECCREMAQWARENRELLEDEE